MKKIIIHPEKCTGCRLCESICTLYNDRVNDPSRSRIRMVKKHSLGLSTPVVCLPCKKPPCSEVCPVNAIMKGSDGVIKIDYVKCTACEACVSKCPFGVMMALRDKVVKCELCGGDPQCVKYCITGAIEYGDIETETRQGRIQNLPHLIETRET